MNHDSLLQKRTRNKSIILRHIKNKNDTTLQTELCQMTGLSKMTVASIVNELKKEKLIKISGHGKASSLGGRKPALIEINKKGACFVTASLDWNECVFAISNMDCEIENERSSKIDFSQSSDKAIAEIGKNLNKIIKKSGIGKEKIRGIGVGMPGVIDSKEGICIYSAKFNWSNIPVAELLKKDCGLPVFIETNVCLQALAEYNETLNKKAKTLFYINVGTGIGSAIIIDGQIYAGSNLMAGEIGHVVVDEKGVKCPCGNSGCLQMYFSEQGFIAQFESLPKTEKTFTFEIPTQKQYWKKGLLT